MPPPSYTTRKDPIDTYCMQDLQNLPDAEWRFYLVHKLSKIERQLEDIEAAPNKRRVEVLTAVAVISAGCAVASVAISALFGG